VGPAVELKGVHKPPYPIRGTFLGGEDATSNSSIETKILDLMVSIRQNTTGYSTIDCLSEKTARQNRRVVCLIPHVFFQVGCLIWIE
jgi:hypothetical protein